MYLAKMENESKPGGSQRKLVTMATERSRDIFYAGKQQDIWNPLLFASNVFSEERFNRQTGVW